MAITQLIQPQKGQVGGISVRRLLPARDRQMVGPFVFMDQGGPVEVPNRPGGGVSEHPHAGLSTFTYLMSGAMNHRDSAGHRATIRSGDIALMTSGSGITHEELADSSDPAPTVSVHFAQMWLALPDALEEMDPAFEHVVKKDLPVVEGKGALARLAMGSAWGRTAPITCHAPTLFAEIELEAGGAMDIAQDYDEQALMLLEGDATLDDAPLTPHALSVLAPHRATLRSARGGRALLLGGAHFPSKRWIGGSFVASSPEKLRRWMQDSAYGRWPRIAR